MIKVDARALRAARLRRGVSMEALAFRTGLSLGRVGRAEEGEDLPGEALDAIGRVLGVSVSALLDKTTSGATLGLHPSDPTAPIPTGSGPRRSDPPPTSCHAPGQRRRIATAADLIALLSAVDDARIDLFASPHRSHSLDVAAVEGCLQRILREPAAESAGAAAKKALAAIEAAGLMVVAGEMWRRPQRGATGRVVTNIELTDEPLEA